MKVDISKKHTFVVCAYKESQYLEECIQSVLNQNVKSKVIISTGTPNSYIKEIAEKYKLQYRTDSKRRSGRNCPRLEFRI